MGLTETAIAVTKKDRITHQFRRLVSLEYLWLSSAIVLVLFISLFYQPMPFIGPVAMIAFIITCGLWLGAIFFKEEHKTSQMLFGIIAVVCWIIVFEGLFAIIKTLTAVTMIVPFVILPVFLIILQKSVEHYHGKTTSDSNVSESANPWRIGDYGALSIFLISFLCVLLTVLSVRTDEMIFSVWQVVPLYFWPLMFANIIAFIVLEKRLRERRYGCIISIISGSLTAFLYFGLMILVVKISFDPDIWGLLSGVRVLFDLGGRDPTGSALVIQYSGYQGFLATFTRMGGSTFNLALAQGATWLWSPIMASIWIPFITYQFLKKAHDNHQASHVFLLGIFGFMLFPTFWLLSVSVAEMVGDILLYVNLFFVTLFISDEKPYRGLFLTSLTTVATLLVHPFPGTFAVMADLVALPFYRIFWNRRITRYLLLLFAIVAALSMFPIEFTFIQNFLFNSSPYQLHLPSLQATSSFWFPSVWLPSQYTADSICSECFNWIRYVLLIGGFLALRTGRNIGGKKTVLWLFLTVMVFWSSWFWVTNGISNLPYGTHRFARDLDILLIPFAAAILYNLSKIGSFSIVVNGKILLNNTGSIVLNLSKKAFRLNFPKARLSGLAVTCLTVLLMLSSFFVAYSVPSLPKNYPAESGRPIWRTVTADEMKIVQLINASSGPENYCVLCNGNFIPELVQGILGYRYYGNEPNLPIASGTVMNSSSQLLVSPYPYLIYNSMIATNSSIAYFITEDWYVNGSSALLHNIGQLRQFASDYQVLGSNYKFYFFKFGLSLVTTRLNQYTHPVEEYDVLSPTAIADDEQPNYWTTFEELSGNIGKPFLSIRNDTKISGNYSTEIRIGNGTYGRVGVYKRFNTALDLSSQKYISFFLCADSTTTVTVYFMAPTPEDSQWFSLRVTWDGWRFIKIPLTEFVVVRGNPDWSQITHISIQFTDVAAGTHILIDKIETSE